MTRLDRAERLRIGLDLVARRVDERARHADIARRHVVVALDLDRREVEQREVALARGRQDRLREVTLEAATVLLELREVRRGQRHDVRVRHEGLGERDRLVRLHRADEALGDLDGLQLRAEETRAPALDGPADDRFEALHAQVLLSFITSAPRRMIAAVT